MKNEERKYIVTIKEKKGTCDADLFEEMAKRGDLTSVKLANLVGTEVKITGYALCNIETDDKNFDINYYDTEEYGLVSSGSNIFRDSVVAYFGRVDSVRLTEVKTKQGKTYKAVPVLKKATNKNEETTNDDLPF